MIRANLFGAIQRNLPDWKINWTTGDVVKLVEIKKFIYN
jgi:hypothetical protein